MKPFICGNSEADGIGSVSGPSSASPSLLTWGKHFLSLSLGSNVHVKGLAQHVACRDFQTAVVMCLQKGMAQQKREPTVLARGFWKPKETESPRVYGQESRLGVGTIQVWGHQGSLPLQTK